MSYRLSYLENFHFSNLLAASEAGCSTLASSKRAGGIFSTITFLKSVGSTDQNAMKSVLFEDGTRKPGIYYATIISYIDYINIKEWCCII